MVDERTAEVVIYFRWLIRFQMEIDSPLIQKAHHQYLNDCILESDWSAADLKNYIDMIVLGCNYNMTD